MAMTWLTPYSGHDEKSIRHAFPSPGEGNKRETACGKSKSSACDPPGNPARGQFNDVTAGFLATGHHFHPAFPILYGISGTIRTEAHRSQLRGQRRFHTDFPLSLRKRA